MKKFIFFSLNLVILITGKVNAINPPTLSSPAAGASFSFFTTSLICNSVPTATGYQFQLDTQSIFNNPPFYIANSAFNGASSPVLRIGKTYFWRARCFKGTDTSVWSSSRSFTVAPGNLALNSPSNNSSGNIVALRSMSVGNDPSIRYQFEADTASNLLSINKRSLITDVNQFIDTTFFKYSQVIFWRTRCFNMYGDTFQWSPVWRYTTHAGPTWSTSSAVFTVDPMYLVNWTNAGLSRIQIQLDVNGSFNSPELKQRFVPSGIIQDTFANLTFGKNYFVRLRGYYGNNFGPWSAVQAIRIKNGVITISPSPGAIISSLNPFFGWSQMGGVMFQFQLFSDMSKSSILKDTLTSSGPYIYTSNLNLNTEYPWRIRAFHETDTSPWVERNFRIFNGMVNLGFPVNNSTVNIRPKFSFTGYSWATKYVMEIDTGSVWPSTPSSFYISIDTFSLASGVYSIDTTLLYAQKYIWRVTAFKGQEQAAPGMRVFTTTAAPINYYPPNNFIGTGPSPNGLVTGIPGSILLQWQMDTTNQFNSPSLASGVDPHIPDDFDPKYIVASMGNDLRFHTKYFWRTRCISMVDTSDWSVPFNFITTQDVWLSSPLNASVNVPISTKLDWGLQGSNFDSRYQYQIATDSMFETKPIFTLAKDAISEVTVNLVHGTRYFWRARVFHAKDTSRWSVINYFNTIPPPAIGVPVLVSPAQGAKNIPLTPIILSWNFSANALSFDIEVSTSADFSTINASGNAQGNASQFSGMQPNTRYYWRVRGRNGNFTSAWATRWFETSPPTSLTENAFEKETQVFPNPASSFISVRTKGTFEVQVKDLTGKNMFSQVDNINELNIQTQDWPAGLYLVHIKQNDCQLVYKILVQP
jgi:hypothetical protein